MPYCPSRYLSRARDEGANREARVSRAAKSAPPPDHLRKAPPPRWQEWLLLPLSILVIAVLIIMPGLWSTSATSLSYTDPSATADNSHQITPT